MTTVKRSPTVIQGFTEIKQHRVPLGLLNCAFYCICIPLEFRKVCTYRQCCPSEVITAHLSCERPQELNEFAITIRRIVALCLLDFIGIEVRLRGRDEHPAWRTMFLYRLSNELASSFQIPAFFL